jgi:hypothetical protein
MSSRNAIIASVGIVLVFVVLLIFVNNANTGPAAARSEAMLGTRQVTVIGLGEVRASPDTAHIQLGVGTERRTAQEALKENNVQANEVVTKLVELGIEEKDIQTSNFSIYPTYDDNGRIITGYRVSNIVAVTIRNLDEAGELLDQVVQVGANRVHGIRFSVDDPSDLLAQALDRAMDNARAKARQLAEAGNADLGEVLVITENVGQIQRVFSNISRGLTAGDEMAQAAPPPVQAGEQQFTTRVQVTYRLR